MINRVFKHTRARVRALWVCVNVYAAKRKKKAPNPFLPLCVYIVSRGDRRPLIPRALCLGDLLYYASRARTLVAAHNCVASACPTQMYIVRGCPSRQKDPAKRNPGTTALLNARQPFASRVDGNFVRTTRRLKSLTFSPFTFYSNAVAYVTRMPQIKTIFITRPSPSVSETVLTVRLYIPFSTVVISRDFPRGGRLSWMRITPGPKPTRNQR